MECDCFIQFKGEPQEKVAGHQDPEDIYEGSGIRLYKGAIFGEGVNDYFSEITGQYGIRGSSIVDQSMGFILKEHYSAGIYDYVYSNPEDVFGNNPCPPYKNAFIQKNNANQPFHFDASENIIHCGDYEATMSCIPLSEQDNGCAVLNRMGISCPSVPTEEQFNPTAFVELEDKNEVESSIYPLFNLENGGYDFVFSTSETTTDYNNKDVRYMLVKAFVSKNVSKYVTNDRSRLIEFYLENEKYKGNPENPNYLQKLVYNADGLVEPSSQNPPIIKYCDQRGGAHDFLLKFRMPNPGTYILTMNVLGVPRGTSGYTGTWPYPPWTYTRTVQVAGNDEYKDDKYSGLQSFGGGTRSLTLNIVNHSAVTPFSSLSKGPFNNFEKTLEDAFSNKNINASVLTHYVRNPVINTFDFNINNCHVSSPNLSSAYKHFDSQGYLILSKEDYDFWYNTRILMGYPSQSEINQFKSDCEKEAIDYAFFMAYIRILSEYIDNCRGLNNVSYDQLIMDVNQVVLFKAKYFKFYSYASVGYNQFSLSDMNKLLDKHYPTLLARTYPPYETCKTFGVYKLCNSSEGFPKSLTHSVVGVYENPFRDSGLHLTDEVGSTDEKMIDFAMIYETAHELIHAWAQPLVINENKSGDDSHNFYLEGNNKNNNVFRYGLDLKSWIIESEKEGIKLSESTQQIINNQLIRKP